MNILHMYHDSPLAAHGGIQNTLDKIKEHYFSPKMSQIVSNYVEFCEYCQNAKFPVHQLSPVLHHIQHQQSRLRCGKLTCMDHYPYLNREVLIYLQL